MIARLGLLSLLAGVVFFTGLVFSETSVAPLLAADDRVDFVKDVQPILQTNCYKCHGPEKQKGLLRWDSKESGLVHGGQSGMEIVAGKSGDSRLIRRVTGL